MNMYQEGPAVLMNGDPAVITAITGHGVMYGEYWRAGRWCPCRWSAASGAVKPNVKSDWSYFQISELHGSVEFTLVSSDAEWHVRCRRGMNGDWEVRSE